MVFLRLLPLAMSTLILPIHWPLMAYAMIMLGTLAFALGLVLAFHHGRKS